MTKESIKGINLLCCYAQEDEALQFEFVKHMSVLRRLDLIASWNDYRIEAGKGIPNSILSQLDEAQLIILLISPDFIAFDFCNSVEMKLAILEHHADNVRIIPIILRSIDPTAWENGIFRELNTLPPERKAVTDWLDTDEALQTIVKVLDGVINERLGWQWFNKGIALHKHNQYEEALVAYDQAIALNFHEATANVIQIILEELERKKEASVDYDSAMKIINRQVSIHNARGDVLFDLKRYEEALTAYETALDINPKNISAWARKGHVLNNLKRRKEAIAAYAQALQLLVEQQRGWRETSEQLRNTEKKIREVLEQIKEDIKKDIKEHLEEQIMEAIEQINKDENKILKTKDDFHKPLPSGFDQIASTKDN